ncbi:MAG: hypothetical protein M3340_07840 [Actinomycetota bacterium]|nr:hypothetical protein [Actinomycetota bacterium]
MANGTHKDYGTYSLTGASLLTIPNVDSKGNVDFFAPPPQNAKLLGNGGGGTLKRKLSNATLPVAKKQALNVPPPAPPPAFNSVCVMDVGQGNCNMLIGSNNEPAAYFDVGYPLWFYRNTAPANLAVGAGAPSGPIPQNTAGNMQVFLSHWDWDHWRLGHTWPALAALPWHVPNQPTGPSALNFFNALPNRVVVPALPRAAPLGNAAILMTSQPPPGAHPAMVMNNTGLALMIRTQLPAAAPLPYWVVITGDANFDSLPAPFPLVPGITGITAVHHGSAAHGADQNLPAPAPGGGAQGRVAYSSGLSPTGYRPYNFPNPGALANYQAANWNAPQEMDTPEGANIRGGVMNRGNIRMGIQTPLAVAYNQTAFFNYPHPLP